MFSMLDDKEKSYTVSTMLQQVKIVTNGHVMLYKTDDYKIIV